jgi:hypothetical protein
MRRAGIGKAQGLLCKALPEKSDTELDRALRVPF